AALLFVVPLPNWPALFSPQSQTVRSDFKTICSDPPPPQMDVILADESGGFLNINSVPSSAAGPLWVVATARRMIATLELNWLCLLFVIQTWLVIRSPSRSF